MATQDELKHVAAKRAVKFISENEYISIGTGPTINIFTEVLSRSGKQIKGAVSTSMKPNELLAKYDIPEVSLSDVSGLAVCMDGAGEVNRVLQMIKDGGDAHLNEKVVASASDKFVCIADEGKYISRPDKFPLPVEVIPHVRSLVSRKLMVMDGEPELHIGFTIFNDNRIVDVHGLYIDRLVSMEDEIDRIIGIVGNDVLGHNAADVLISGTEQGAKVILPGQN